MTEAPKLIKEQRCFGGAIRTYRHFSNTCQKEMQFGVFCPPEASTQKVPILYWLSGLTCTEENFMAKSGAFKRASELGLFLVMPDTSPRDCGIEGEDQDWDLGSGASFYVDATEGKWAENYQMFSYIRDELPELVFQHFPVDSKHESIFGHSMGGHGALIIGLNQPGRFRSISAFSPICSLSECAWGDKALSAYLGSDRKSWDKYDACKIIASDDFKKPQRVILIDQGDKDEFLKSQLNPNKIEEICKVKDVPLNLQIREGYDHSYFFISTFIDDHLDFHWNALKE